MRAVISGGGTGGHIYPALAIAEELRARGDEILYMGGADSTEEELVKGYGFDFASVATSPLHRNLLKVVGDLAANCRGMHEARKIIADFAPSVAIGTGGFVTAPVLSAAQSLHIPTMIHEQNAFPGLANRRLAQKAEAVCLTFAPAQRYFPHQERIHYTGLPVRQRIIDAGCESFKREAYAFFEIPEAERTIPTLLITGGSQGAQSINEAAYAAYSGLLDAGYRIIHLCGKKNYFSMKQKAPQDKRLILLPYLEQMEYGLAVADLALARAGASFLAEVAVLGLPTILVPYPYATNDHQAANAKVFSEEDAAVMIKDTDLNGERLLQIVQALFNNPVRLERMQAGAHLLAKTTAAADIADVAYSIAKNK